jgi:hypothetical protein
MLVLSIEKQKYSPVILTFERVSLVLGFFHFLRRVRNTIQLLHHLFAQDGVHVL